MTQIVDNGFFHADPHPGNILVRGDDIVWIDLGMVGQLSALERALIGRMFRAVAENDPYALMEALLGAVRSEGPVNHGRLLSQLGNLLVSYTTVNLADINDLGIPIDAIAALYSVSGTVAMALISAGLFIGSSLLATTNMHPQFLGVPLLGVLGYVGAFVLGAYVVWRNLVIRHRQKNEEKL